MGAIPIDKEVFTLANLARMAASRGQGAFSEFYRSLSEVEQLQLREIDEELTAIMRPLPNFQDPADRAMDEFSKLVWRTETSLPRHAVRQVFRKWIDVLTPRLDKKVESYFVII